jgi:hypothetical protein
MTDTPGHVTPPPHSHARYRPADIGHAVGLLVSLPAYFLACAAGLGLIAVLAASSGAAGLALFAGLHMLLALVSAAWRVQELGMVPPERPPVAQVRTARQPVSVARMPTGAGSPGV